MEVINITCKAHLTEGYQLEQANKLISKLKVELSAANEYIAELEESGVTKEKEDLIKALQKENESLKQANAQLRINHKNMKDKYSLTVSQIKDSIIDKLQKEKEELQKKVEELVKVRDHLMYKLYETNI